MDGITIPYSDIRAIKSACRKTGTKAVTLKHEGGVTTFAGQNGSKKVRVSGKVTAGEVKFATAPKRAQAKAATASDDDGDE